jgi:hypothetical protein
MMVLGERDGSEVERFAASELERYLGQIFSGAGAGAGEKGPAIRLKVVKQAGVSDEAYGWRSDGEGFWILGGGELGLVFGVYGFLRDVVGCVFAAPGPDGEFVPELKRLAVPADRAMRGPLLSYRTIQLSYQDPEHLMHGQIDWALKNGVNYVTYLLANNSPAEGQVDPQSGVAITAGLMQNTYLRPEYFHGKLLGHIRARGMKLDFSHHNLLYWLPAEQYFKEHPTWYMLVDGVRGKPFSQLAVCTSNADAVGEMIANIKAYIRAYPGIDLVGVIPEDGIGMCQCAACVAGDVSALDCRRVYKGHMTEDARNASKSARYARLLNQIAEALEGEFPHVKIPAVAYVDLQWPAQGIKLHKNIVVGLALYWRDGARPVYCQGSSVVNRAFEGIIDEWSGQIGERLGLYEYYMGMNAQASLPYPMSEVILEDWEALRARGLRGASIQCNSKCHHAYGLNMLAFAKSAWEEKTDHGRLMDEYLLGEFGAAGEALKGVFEFWQGKTRGVAAREADSEGPCPAGIPGWVLQPTLDNVSYFMEGLSREAQEGALTAALGACENDRERRQVERFANYLRYCRGADAFLRFVRESEGLEARERVRVACELAQEVLAAMGSPLAEGWIEPVHANHYKRRLKVLEKAAGG